MVARVSEVGVSVFVCSKCTVNLYYCGKYRKKESDEVADVF